MDPKESGEGELLSSTPPSNWTNDVSDIKTVKISNVSLAVSQRDIYEFFIYSGEIQYIEMQRSVFLQSIFCSCKIVPKRGRGSFYALRETETTNVALVTFMDSKGAETAALLTGATISGLPVSITPCPNYQLPPHAVLLSSGPKPTVEDSTVRKAEDVVSTMLANGYVLGKDAFSKAKALDEKHQLTSNASATMASIDQKMGLSEKISIGTAVVNEKVKEIDERFQVSELTKSALAAAEEKASNAGAVIMSNRYVSSGALWISSAFSAVSKAASEVSTMAKEKAEKAEVEKERGDKGKEAEMTTHNAKVDQAPEIAVIKTDETK